VPEFFQRPRRMIILFLSDTLSAAALIANPARNECAPNSLTGHLLLPPAKFAIVRDVTRRAPIVEAPSSRGIAARYTGEQQKRQRMTTPTRHPRLKSGVWPFSTFNFVVTGPTQDASTVWDAAATEVVAAGCSAAARHAAGDGSAVDSSVCRSTQWITRS
jgi:hypothetical protein